MNRLTELWLLISVGAGLAGWLLSVFNALNATGYLVCLVAAVLLAGGQAWRRRQTARPPGSRSPVAWRKLRRRFRRPLPLAFLVLSLLALAGGALYPTNNYDELTYRLPRVLHWLSAGHWHWIHAADARLNTRASEFEFLTAPVLALLRSDRPFFLINAISYLLLPGLLYSVFLRLGVRRRVARCWMWLLPTALNFLLQAASTANDGFAAVYVLAAVGYALRAKETGRVGDLWLSGLAAALMTGAKASNLPLLLPWVVACWPALRLLARRPYATAGAITVGALVSFLPNALFNIRYCGDWSGAVLEASHLKLANPFFGLLGNAVSLAMENLTPPVAPFPPAVADHLLRLVPAWFINTYNRSFAFEFKVPAGMITTEDGAGLGPGIVLLLAASLVAAAVWRLRAGKGNPVSAGRFGGGEHLQLAVVGSAWVAFVVFCSHAGMGQIARLSAPYYPLLAVAVLRGPAQAAIVRRRWWAWGAGFTLLLSLAVLVLSPARPLFPAQTLLGWLQAHHAGHAALDRARASYKGFAERNDALRAVRALLPADATVVGFVSSGNDIEPSLWRPFGERRVVHFLPADPVSRLRQCGARYVVVSGNSLTFWHQSWEEWLSANQAEAIASISVDRAYPPYRTYEWHLARLR